MHTLHQQMSDRHRMTDKRGPVKIDTAKMRQLNAILMQYGLRANEILPCSSHYKKIAGYRVLTDKGVFFLKAFRGPRARLNRVYAHNTWLQRANFNHLPEWRLTIKGRHAAETHGRLYYITEWLEGSAMGSEQDYEKLGEVLAQLHRVSRRRCSAQSAFTALEIKRLQRHHGMFARHLRSMRSQNNDFGRWVRKKEERCLALAEEAWQTLRLSSVQRNLRMEKPVLIHGDVTRPNVIVRSGELYLIDWELVRQGSRYYEIAKTLSNVTHFSTPYIQAFLSGYEKHRPFTAEERLIISSLCRLPREAWLTVEQMRLGRRTALFNILRKTWNARMKMIKWLDSWATGHRS
ncbi:phosphotransferase [Paenibacillus xerothermodurans]|uniref:Aminoglycoside phosphotransferase domain-containing protein n=1 Tax=Paenibacillus xerothermodurans TaxID=1977292 RepID=A0A2W1P6Q4_PAEXE|nr:phosphotransferase [Paenibacillus xerothermodurans]PZE22738.1 hypothetical protein CBW46_002940 [Paenibacillus xerothermodurans]